MLETELMNALLRPAAPLSGNPPRGVAARRVVFKTVGMGWQDLAVAEVAAAATA